MFTGGVELVKAQSENGNYLAELENTQPCPKGARFRIFLTSETALTESGPISIKLFFSDKFQRTGHALITANSFEDDNPQVNTVMGE